jgi:putative transposase
LGLDQRREIALTAISEFGIPESRSCKLANVKRNTYRYKLRYKDDTDVEQAIRMCIKKRRHGCPMIIKMIRKSGKNINHKRIRRVYKKLKLTLPKKVRKRLPVRERKIITQPLEPNLTWSMDFMNDSLVGGRRFRTLNVMDDFNREVLTMEIATSIPAARVIRALDHLKESRGLPKTIRVDNGPEYISKLLKKWAEYNELELLFIQPGKPTQNSLIERLNGTCRRELLNANWFFDLNQVRELAQEWMEEYNTERPHSGLGNRTPIEFLKWRQSLSAGVNPGGKALSYHKEDIKENSLL